MIYKTLRHSSTKVLATTFSALARVFRWNWISIIALGISSNWTINAIFDYKYQRPLVSFSAEEYINAIVAAWVLLKGTRWITKQLDKRVPWIEGVRRRLFVQFGLHLVFIIVALNALLISITYFFYGGFYAFGDLMVINLSVVSLTFIFSIIDAGIYFFNNWSRFKSSNSHNNGVKKPIKISLGKVHHLLEQEKIRTALSRSGSVFIVTDEGRNLIYSQSLDNLMKCLDPNLFFRANRQTILTYPVIKTIKGLEYGKIEAILEPISSEPSSVIISRTRAAEFRKWLKSHTS